MQSIWSFFAAQADNEIFIAALGLLVVGALAYMLVRLLDGLYGQTRWLIAQLLRKPAYTIMIENDESAYHELLNLFESEGAFKDLPQAKLEFFRRAKEEATGAESEPETVVERVARPSLGTGSCTVTRGGETATLARYVSQESFPGSPYQRYERLSLRFDGKSPAQGAALFETWRQDASAYAHIKLTSWPEVYTLTQDGWSYGARIRPRMVETIVTKDGAAERLIADGRRFREREAWYIQRAVPWRRGYLLYGPAGTGKSSLIRAAATELGLDLAIIDLARKGLDDAQMREALAEMPANAALVLEDVDAAFNGRDRAAAAEGLTFSGVLNALDGLATAEGLIVFMTTNHRERLDPALIRPGRADLHIELGYASPAEAERLYRRFFPEEETLAENLAKDLSGEAAPAAIQAALLDQSEDPAQAYETVRALFGAAPKGSSETTT